MKIVNIIGGLGNQMFQYAFAYSLSLKHPEEQVLIDTSLFNGYKLHNGFEIDRVFGCKLPIATRRQIRKVNWFIPNYTLARGVRKLLPARKTVIKDADYLTYKPHLMDLSGNYYYDGYWQSSRYFDKYRDAILSLFQFKELPDNNRTLAAQIKGSESVTIHVRRGDYLGAPNYIGICDLEYYKKAILEAKRNLITPSFFIFSNDSNWCKECIIPLLDSFPATIVDINSGLSSYNDMRLMSLARCNILANSSFSWWATYLNEREDRITISPSKWVNLVPSTDIFLDSWIKI